MTRKLSQGTRTRVHEGMWTLIRNGGVIPMSVLLLFGLVSLLASGWFAVRGERKLLGFVKGMAAATLFTTLAASAAAVGATLYAASDTMAHDNMFHGELVNPWHLVVQGLAESTSPAILGFSFLALTAMLGAVGARRLDERERA